MKTTDVIEHLRPKIDGTESTNIKFHQFDNRLEACNNKVS